MKVFFPLKKEFHTYLQVMVFILAITFSILTIVNTATNGCCEEATWHVGLFAIILGWTYLLHLSSKFPFIGEQAIVFLHIVWTFLKLTAFALLLVLAATIILVMTFYNAQAVVSCNADCFHALIHCAFHLAFTFLYIQKRNCHSGNNDYG